MSTPRFASALSTAPGTSDAERECVETLLAGLDGVRPDLLLVFVTHHHGDSIENLGPRLARATGAPVVLGCTGESVIGADREVEEGPALSLWAASLPGTRVQPFDVLAQPGPDDAPSFSTLPPVEEPDLSSVLLLADPFSFPVDVYLREIDEAWLGVPVVGGMASGGTGPGQNLLVTAAGVREGGAIGVVVEGAVELRSVVSQGCRPVAKPWVITACEGNVVQKLGGRTAAEVLFETLGNLGPDDQRLFRTRPFVGLAVDPRKSEFERGDFLVRMILGVSREDGSMAVAEQVRRGQTIQFLVRDADSAGQDLRSLLRAAAGPGAGDHEAGALLFTCNGRGTHMFPAPDHDVGCIKAELGEHLPVAGFFANGEIGPVGGRNHLHGFTASVAIFRARR